MSHNATVELTTEALCSNESIKQARFPLQLRLQPMCLERVLFETQIKWKD